MNRDQRITIHASARGIDEQQAEDELDGYIPEPSVELQAPAVVSHFVDVNPALAVI